MIIVVGWMYTLCHTLYRFKQSLLRLRLSHQRGRVCLQQERLQRNGLYEGLEARGAADDRRNREKITRFRRLHGIPLETWRVGKGR